MKQVYLAIICIISVGLFPRFGFEPGFGLGVKSGEAAASQDTRTGPSGNPIPRFVSLSTDEANMRTGPGRQYPISWVYGRRNLPLEVVDEFGPWREVRDHEGSKGWIHVSLLDGRRTAMIRGDRVNLYAKASSQSAVRLIAEEGVIGVILECDQRWCRLELEGSRAWIEAGALWGVYPGELID